MPRLKTRNITHSLSFDGSDDKVDLGSDFIGTSACTVCAWINIKGYGEANIGRIIDNRKTIFNLSGTTKRLNFLSDGSTVAVSATGSINLNKWYFVCVTRTSTGVANFYVNGVLNGTANQNSGTPVAGDNNLILGNDLATTRTFNGLITKPIIYNSVLSATQISNLYYNNIIPSGVVASYFDSPSTDGSGTVLTDSVGGNNGTITGATWSTDTPIKSRMAVRNDLASLSFDGSGDYIEGTTSPIMGANTLSIVARVKLKNTGAVQTIVEKWNADADEGINIYADASGNLASRVYKGGGTTTSTKFICDNRWYTVAMTYNKVLHKLYVDGDLVKQSSITVDISVDNAQKLQIGRRRTGIVQATGYIKDVFVYSTVALTAKQISDLHYNGIISRTGLHTEYLMNEGVGSTVNDTSGNGNHGTITGATWSTDVPMKERQLVNPNLVKNGDFEYAPPFTAATNTSARWIDGTAGGSATNNLFRWFFQLGSSVIGTAKFDSSVFSSGLYSLKIVSTTPNSGSSVGVCVASYAATSPSAEAQKLYLIQIKPNTQYTVTAYIKTEDIVSGDNKGAILSLMQYNGVSSSSVGSVSSDYIVGTNGWTKVTVNFTSVATAAVLNVRCMILGDTTGIAWFDDIVLEPTTPTARTLTTTRTLIT